MILLLSIAFSETAARQGANATEETSAVPEGLACATVTLDDFAEIDVPFEVTLANGCAVDIEVREPDCEEVTTTADHDGCARLVVAPGEQDFEGTSIDGWYQGDFTLQWFDPAAPEVVATRTWSVRGDWGGPWDSDPPDTDPPQDSDSADETADDTDVPDASPEPRCGCDTGTAGMPWLVGLAGLLLVRR